MYRVDQIKLAARTHVEGPDVARLLRWGGLRSGHGVEQITGG
jgi:hypothetical protein